MKEKIVQTKNTENVKNAIRDKFLSLKKGCDMT